MPTAPDTTGFITIAQEVLSDWNDTLRSGYTYELWVFSSDDWVDANGTFWGRGTMSNRKHTVRVTGLSASGQNLTIPSFQIPPTRNAQQGKSTVLRFHIVQVNGSNVVDVCQVPFTENGIQVPQTLASNTGCSPTGLCGNFADLVRMNSPSPALPNAPEASI